MSLIKQTEKAGRKEQVMRANVTGFMILAGILLFLTGPAVVDAADNSFTFKIGYNFFQGEQGWHQGEVLGPDSSQYDGRMYGLEWDIYPVPAFGLRFTLEYFHQERYTNYQYTGDGYSGHTSRSLYMRPFTISAVARVPHSKVTPYFFAGIGFYNWGIYENDGGFWDWIDDETLYEDDAIGLQFGGGLEFEFSRRVAFRMEAEFRAVELDLYWYNTGEDLDASSIVFNTGIVFG